MITPAPDPPLAQVIAILQRDGCSFDPDGRFAFAVFEPITPVGDYDEPFGLFTMDPGCDQPYYHGATGTFWFVRAEVESDRALHCWDKYGHRITFYRCLDPDAKAEWDRYRQSNPTVQRIEAEAIAERKANPDAYLGSDR